MPPQVVIFLGVCLVIGLVIWSFIRRSKQRDALRQFASRRGLQFSQHDAWDIPEQLGGFGLMQEGHGRDAGNVLWGNHAGAQVRLFEYEYKTGSGKNQTTHSYCCVSWRLPVRLSGLVIRPEGLFDTLAEWFGYNDIDFESSQFSRKYHVSGQDREEVYAVIDPRMMEFLLGAEVKNLQVIGDSSLAYVDKSWLTPELCDWLLAVAEGFNLNIPAHVVQSKGGI